MLVFELIVCFFFFIAEYDPNPLLSLSKRRRRTSTSVSTEERRLSQSVPSPLALEPKMNELPGVQEVEGAEAHRERKRLKKRKREKLKKKLLHEERHRKKHKCLETHCKHRKHHKKHRKHKKRHHSKEVVEEKDSGIQIPEEMEEISTESNDTEDFPEYQIIANPEDEVTMDDIIKAGKKVCL